MNLVRIGVAAFAGLVLLGATPSAEARLSCSFSGPPQNQLTVTVTGLETNPVVRRSGDRIVVSRGLGSAATCSGGEPTVFTTDNVSVLLPPTAIAELRLGGGPLAPGATPEAEGASEIEVELRGGFFHKVRGTPGADEFQWGQGGNKAGLNLDPGTGADDDVDVRAVGRLSFLVAYGGAGNDRIVPGAGAVDDNRGINADGGRGDDVLTAPQNTHGVLVGRSGNDIIRGGRLGDFGLYGGAGADRIAGREGDDRIDGGRGRDLLLGGTGRDLIDAHDHGRDVVRCGAGRDHVKADRRDRLRGCEVVLR